MTNDRGVSAIHTHVCTYACVDSIDFPHEEAPMTDVEGTDTERPMTTDDDVKAPASGVDRSEPSP